MVSVETKVPLP